MSLMKIKDICLKIGSGATPRGGKEAYIDTGISLIRSQNVLDFWFSHDGLAHINEQQASKLSNVIVEKGDVLLNITGDSVARACIVNDNVLPARVNQHVAIIRANPEIVLGSYILYYLQMIKPYLLQLAAGGATRNALTKGMIEELEIDVPSIEEQKGIVSLVDDIQKKIKVNTSINENLEQQAQAIFESSIINATTKVKNGVIGDYCAIKSGYAFKSSWWVNDGVQVVKIKNIDNGILNLTECSCVSLEKIEIAKDFLVAGGDVLIAMTGATIGKFAVVPKYDKPLLVNQRVGRFFLGNNPVEKLPFLFCTLKLPEVITEIINRGQGSAQPNVSTTDIMTTPCYIPNNEIITSFNKICKPLFESVINRQQENQSLSNLRETLLPKLMNGEINVSNVKI